MSITLFYSPFCPPARSVYLVARALNLRPNIVEVNLLSERYKFSRFKTENPEKTVPCLKDGNDYIWDSHAISGYLVNQYGGQSNLIPKNFIQEAKVERMLHFESEYLTPLACDTLVPILLRRNFRISKLLKESVKKAYSVLENELHDTWLTGNNITIADLSCITSLTTLDLLIPVSENSKLCSYVLKFKELPYYQEGNQNGLNIIAEIIMNRLMYRRHSGI